MNKPRISLLLYSAISVFILVCTILVFTHKEEEPVVKLNQVESSFFQEGNVQSRVEYEQQMLIDPQLGYVPQDIRKKELEFARQVAFENEKLQSRYEKAGSQQTQINTWKGIGPYNIGGRTRAIGMDVRDERVLIAGGVSGGIWKSTNLGITWARKGDSNQVQGVTALTQDVRAGKEDTWYYGTGELVGNSTRAPGAPFRGDGIFKTTDNGETWQPLASTQVNMPGTFGSPFQYVWNIETGLNNAQDEVYAAIYGGIVKSSNGGQTWTTVLGSDLLNTPAGTDLNDLQSIFYTDVHRASDGVLYASLSSVTNDPDVLSTQGGVYRSEDGVSWSRILAMTGVFCRRIIINSSKTEPGVVYFLADRGSAGYGLWRYTEASGPMNFSTNIPDGSNDVEAYESQSSYNMALAIHPNNSDVVYIGGTNLYRSTDGFRSRRNTRWIGGYNPNTEDNDVEIYPNHHPDQHDIVFLQSDANKMITANDGGLFLTDNNLAEDVEYISLNNGFVTTQFYTAGYSQFQDDDFAIGGTQDNGSLLTFDVESLAGPNGLRVIGGDGGFVETTPFGAFYYMSFQNSQIYRLTLNSQGKLTSFARVDPSGGGSDPSQPYLFVNPYILDPNNANRMYLAGGDHIWFNKNTSQIPSGSQTPASVNWSKLHRTEIQEGVISAVEVSTEPKNILFYGTSIGQLFKVVNAHSEVYEVDEITSDLFPENAYIRNISVDPTNADHIAVSFSNYGVPSIFRSTDGGRNFEDISGNLEENPDGSGNGPSVRWVTIVPLEGGGQQYFAATSTGLYSSLLIDGSSTLWMEESSELISRAVINMLDYRREDGKMVAASHGHGLYTTQIQNVKAAEPLVVNSDFVFETLYPNPFSDEVAIRLILPETQFVIIRIYDSSGAQVKVVTSNLGFVGENEFFWDGTDVFGRPLSNGLYLIRVTYKGQSQVKRVVLQRD